MSRKRKVKIIGSTGYHQSNEDVHVDCTNWDKIDKIKNIRDYDTLIINLLPFLDSEKRSKINWGNFSKNFNFHFSVDILSNNGEIIIVGDPRFKISKENDPDEILFLNWTGIEFEWDPQPGDTINYRNDYRHSEFENYISNFKKWEYSLNNCTINDKVISTYFNMDYLKEKKYRIELERDFFCTNRYGNALASKVSFQIKRKDYDRSVIVNSFGPIILLPAISLSEDETIQLILKDICGVHTSLPEPEWISEYTAPGQKEIDDKIRQINTKIENDFKELDKSLKEKEEIRKCLKLLYEREYALEPVVRDILRKIGAHVEDPSEPNKEDGWLSIKIDDKIYEGVLEIKSTRSNQFDENGRKQLLDWIDRGRTLRDKNYKGIFIGSNAVDKPLNERPYAFSDSWSKAAKLSNICAFKTEELYAIYLLFTMRKIDINNFWREIFENNGIFDMKEYLSLLVPKENSVK